MGWLEMGWGPGAPEASSQRGVFARHVRVEDGRAAEDAPFVCKSRRVRLGVCPVLATTPPATNTQAANMRQQTTVSELHKG
jgi:hypothetical protein